MKKFFKWLFIFLLILIIISIIFIFAPGYQMYKDSIEKISLDKKIDLVMDDKNYVRLNQIPIDYQNAVIAIEDHRFKKHGGIDVVAIVRAIVANINEGDIVQGGSTITQQLAKNLYFSQEQEFSRKIAELLVAFDLEETYSKEDILELYINTIYFGSGYYGIKEACNGYFNKEPADMTFDEMTLLAGIPNAPSIYSLNANPDLAKQRQEHVVNAMREYGFID